MNTFRAQRLLLAFVFWFVLGSPYAVTPGQTPPPSQPAPAAEQVKADAQKTILTLTGIVQAIAALQEKSNDKAQELQAADTDDQKTRLGAELQELTKRADALAKDFESIATGVDLESFTPQPRKSFDWKEELQQILTPFIEEMKRVTARSREIERFRNEAATAQNQLAIVRSALANVNPLQTQATAPKLTAQLRAVAQNWRDKQQELENQLAIAQYRLDDKLKEERPLVESAQEVLRLFFKSRGRNLLLALLAFLLIFLLFRGLHRVIFRPRPPRKPTLKPRKRTFYMRLIDVLYYILTFLGATMGLLGVLYLSGDWVLLALALIFLFGLAWTAKQALPLFWEQVKLLLNLSTVRENERVILNGLPWKVATLNLNSRLHNPALKGGLVRLPLRELVKLQSRPFYKHEPWFPCQEQDWVLLADGTFGQVALQTPEMVQLVLLGGSRKTYPTLAFLRQHPNNLSADFRLNLTVSLDYQQHARNVPDVLEKLQAALQAELAQKGYQQTLRNLTVEFKAATATVLDVAIIADFAGPAAKDYDLLSRLLPRLAVAACQQHGWALPVTKKITVQTMKGE